MYFKLPFARVFMGICAGLFICVATLAQTVTKPPVTKPPVTKSLVTKPTSSKPGSGTAAAASPKSSSSTTVSIPSKSTTKTTSSKPGSGTAVTSSSTSGTKTPSSGSATSASPSPAAATEADAFSFRFSWGPIVSGNALAAQVASIAPAAILVKDNNGKLYEVSSFRINYKFKSSYRDEEAGSTKLMNDLRVSEFSGTAQLPDYWVSSIKDNIKAGDEIIFNKILFRNNMGKLQLAPELRITVQ